MDPEKIIDAEFEVIRPSYLEAFGNLVARLLALGIWAAFVAWSAPRLMALLKSITG